MASGFPYITMGHAVKGTRVDREAEGWVLVAPVTWSLPFLSVSFQPGFLYCSYNYTFWWISAV